MTIPVAPDAFPAAARPRSSARRLPLVRVLWVVLGVIFLMGPLIATFFASIDYNRLGYRFTAYHDLLDDESLRGPLWLSFQIAVWTAVASFLLMVPTVYWMHLKVPRARPLIETISLLPFVIPPIIHVVGVAQLTHGWPEWIIARPFFLVPIYVVTCFPFLFRSLDAGMRAIDLVTLTEAARNLGASWANVLLRVIIPNLRTALLGSLFLTLAVVLGEFTISSLLLFNTFPVKLAEVGGSEAQGAAALSLLAFAFSWIFLLVLNALGRHSRRRTGDESAAVVGAITPVP